MQHLLQTLDKLREAGFIRSHLFLHDQHTIQFTERGLALVHAIRDLEAAIPRLSEAERSGLWHLFRLTELRAGPNPPSLPPSGQAAENRDQATTTQALAETVTSLPARSAPASATPTL